MRVLFLMRNYKVGDGASNAIYQLLSGNPSLEGSVIAARYVPSHQGDVRVVKVDSSGDLRRLIAEGDFDVVHYVKLGGYEMLRWASDALRREGLATPVVTTVCQRPSYPGLLLSEWEVSRSNRVVFIDKAAYADPLFDFVPDSRKAQIYFGYGQEIARLADKIRGEREDSDAGSVVFGRGSTLSKCPEDMVEVFDRIDLPGKRLTVAGVAPQGNWLADKTQGRQDITLVPSLPTEDWLRLCAGFDVFLYQLPVDSHASIDATLGHAMLLGVPVVYYGCAAPKERIVSGVNGFVAETIDDFVAMASRLGRDPGLRRRIGEEGRRTTLRDFSIQTTRLRYDALYREVLAEKSRPDAVDAVKAPAAFRRYFLRTQWKELLKSRLAGTVVERWHRKFKPVV